ncbi:MAG: hypothetical protein IPI44_12845 [Sulfuritalea sp.]|nr:hypothetical protein [Sulfuritalea sp.]
MFDSDLPVAIRLVRMIACGVLLFLAYVAIHKPYAVMLHTNTLISSFAKENALRDSSMFSIDTVRRRIVATYTQRAAEIGALPDAEVDATVDAGQLVVVATGSVPYRFATCCALVYDVSLSSDRKFLKSLLPQE